MKPTIECIYCAHKITQKGESITCSKPDEKISRQSKFKLLGYPGNFTPRSKFDACVNWERKEYRDTYGN